MYTAFVIMTWRWKRDDFQTIWLEEQKGDCVFYMLYIFVLFNRAKEKKTMMISIWALWKAVNMR